MPAWWPNPITVDNFAFLFNRTEPVGPQTYNYVMTVYQYQETINKQFI